LKGIAGMTTFGVIAYVEKRDAFRRGKIGLGGF
jgi:hypothetical protein